MILCQNHMTFQRCHLNDRKTIIWHFKRTRESVYVVKRIEQIKNTKLLRRNKFVIPNYKIAANQKSSNCYRKLKLMHFIEVSRIENQTKNPCR